MDIKEKGFEADRNINDERLIYDARNLIILAEKMFPGVELSPAIVLSCRRFQTGADAQLLEAISLQLETRSTSQSVEDRVALASIEENDHGVSMESIYAFANNLKFAFGISKDFVLSRLKSTLTREKLTSLTYFQDMGHELDATKVTDAGEVEFDTCTSGKVDGSHRKLTYLEALKLANENGAQLMTREKYNSFASQHRIIQDKDTYSYLFSEPQYELPANAYCVGVKGESYYYVPEEWDRPFPFQQFRVTIVV